MHRIRMGTRKSRLSLKQTELAERALKKAIPNLQTELVPFHTRGDQILDKPLWEIGSKGLFASEFEEMILNGEIDIAIHSGKDLPLFLADGLSILGVLERGDPRDVLVMPKGRKAEDCRVIGTGSLRRQEFLSRLFPGAACRLIRGNIHTRLQKMMDGGYDGIMLAKAGLDRMGITEADGYAFRVFSVEECLPAACQGIIVVEGKADWAEMVGQITHRETELVFETEREVLMRLNADCSEPAAAFAALESGGIHLRAMYGKKQVEGIAPVAQRRELAADVVRRLRG